MYRFIFLSSIIISGLLVQAQDLEPRLMSMLPVKGNFILASYSYSHGNVLLDKTLPVEDLNASVHILGAAYARSFKLFGRLAKIDVVIPYSFGTWEALVMADDSTTSRCGFGDPLFRISIHFLNGPALSASDYSGYPLKRFRMGLQFRIRPPWGQYDPEKFVNLGLNRWSFKLGLGASYKIKKLILEAHLNGWYFTTNNNFYGGNQLKQHPLFSLQGHVVYVFKQGLWISGSLGASFFGGINFNQEKLYNSKNNLRFGLGIAFPIGKSHGLKIAYTNGAATRYGSDFNSIVLIYQFMRFDN
jgi:hypothetical protein